MRYKVQHYAESLFESLKDKEGKAREVVLKNFLKILRKNNDYAALNRIVRQFEKVYLKKHHQIKVYLETPEKASEHLKKDIKDIVEKDIVFAEKINPKLLAGAVILINDSILIDASAQTRLTKLFAK